ncbi:MAG: hypothetical protein GX363_04230 [Clostridiales bacterium]|nr:hypothetical protein [Clostridiales bacterium]
MAVKLSVIKGGNKKILSMKNRKFISAYVTDTRLMGVLALSIKWQVSTSNGNSIVDQFFYFDAEEYGLETYKSIIDGDEDTITAIELGIIGGLGGDKVSVSEKEAQYLVQSFVKESERLKVSLPEPVEEYDFLFENQVQLTKKEHQELIEKICTPILSDYHLIHYFVMRCVGRDFTGASYLIEGRVDMESVPEPKPASLCKNSIEEYKDKNGQLSYLCEALIEYDHNYMILVLEVTIRDNKVTSVSRRSSMKVSSVEAAMLMNRPEFVTVYEIMADPDTFDDIFIPLTVCFMHTPHNNGRLFLEFKKNNNHVNQKVFRLNEDVYGLYYVSDYGQLILAAYGIDEIHSLERKLLKSSLDQYLIPVAKYEFKEPILYEFILSDFEDFNDFLEAIK